jgi:hypothetical protein
MVEYKKYIGLVVLISVSLLLLASCGTEDDSGFIKGLFTQDNAASVENDAIEVESELVEVVIEEEEIIEEESKSCEVSSECEWNEYCIDGSCGLISDIYDTDGDCESKCNFDNVQISTSDGEELTLSRGKGSYTSAGALEWKLLSSANYCQGEDATPVAIELIMKNLGKILEKKVIILEVGEESKTLRHPELDSVEFQLAVDSYDEICSVE